MATDEATPLMRQFWELKAQAGDALLLFRMGDFYELFGDDAVEAARLLEITLTSRDKGKADPMPMAGVPHHSVQSYIQKLLRAGRKVAIAEQLEAPGAPGKTIVRREIIRVFTPAVQFDLEGSESAYLAAAAGFAEGAWRLALLEASTGELLLSESMTPARLADEVASLGVRHFLKMGSELPEPLLRWLEGSGALVEELPRNYLSLERAGEVLREQFALSSLDAFFPDDASRLALGTVVAYAARSQRQERLAHVRLPRPLRRKQAMAYGPRTPEHLELSDLYGLVNRTRSAPGARRLRRWLAEPLSVPAEIAERQSAVRWLAENPGGAKRVAELSAQAYDVERICGRLTAGLASPRDTLALGRTIAVLPGLAAALAGAEPLVSLSEGLARSHEALRALGERILRTLREDAPNPAREGGVFARGADAELDRLLTLTEDGQRWLVDLEAREREATGISSLKVRYNRVFGYYIEVTHAHLKSVPDRYQRKQTTVGAERFFTEELKIFEDEIVTAEAKRRALETRLFDELIAVAREATDAVLEAAGWIGEADALTALARLAGEPGWAFPSIDDSLDLDLEAGRHPLVDAASRGAFVPNDTRLSPATRMTLLITGPNMGGKSTVMRQVALIVVLGQVGAPVPAARARWGAVSSLHTLIGAHDAIARGQSTFMVEMSELAHILHHADERSLLVLDEIGRGTSTYDGISVAWATLEWVCRKVRARTLFATHYHELTRLDSELPQMANAHLAVATGGEAAGRTKLRFLYKLREGATNESFGIHVAQLAGLPAPVIERAWEVLDRLEAGAGGASSDLGTADQLPLFGDVTSPSRRARALPAPPEVPPALRELEATDVNSMTPLQALNFLARLKEGASIPAANLA